MFNLIKFQFRRLFRSPRLYCFLGIAAVMTFIAMNKYASNYESFLKYSSAESEYILSHSYTVEKAIFYCLYQQSFFLYLLFAVFTAIFVTEDRVKGTIKNIYSRGYPRAQVFLSKYLATISAIIMMLLVIILISLVGALLMGLPFQPTIKYQSEYTINGAIYETTSSFSTFLYHFLRYIALTTLFFMFSELVGTTGFAVTMNIFAPYVIFLAIGLVCDSILYTLYTREEANNIINGIMVYWSPMLGGLFSYDGIDYKTIWSFIFVFIGYIAVFGGLSLLITQKKQIKN